MPKEEIVVAAPDTIEIPARSIMLITAHINAVVGLDGQNRESTP